MRYSLREVFNFSDSTNEATSESTAALLEMYGITKPVADVDNSQHISESDESFEGIHRIANKILEGANTEIVSPSSGETDKKTVNRDDLVLDRWRKMAGLQDTH